MSLPDLATLEVYLHDEPAPIPSDAGRYTYGLAMDDDSGLERPAIIFPRV